MDKTNDIDVMNLFSEMSSLSDCIQMNSDEMERYWYDHSENIKYADRKEMQTLVDLLAKAWEMQISIMDKFEAD